MTADRPFRKAVSPSDARRYLTEWAGIEFDPRVVKAFLTFRKTAGNRRRELLVLESDHIRIYARALKSLPKSWLSFELNVLRRMKFESAAIPFSHNSALGSYLKRWNIRVSANDPLQSAWTKAVAVILNNGEKLSAEDVNVVLEDAYVPRYRLQNPALREWFNETDAWWFDNVRQSIDLLPTPVSRAIASG
jgi:hypothetical protein